jgi:hypothetical protein
MKSVLLTTDDVVEDADMGTLSNFIFLSSHSSHSFTLTLLSLLLSSPCFVLSHFRLLPGCLNFHMSAEAVTEGHDLGPFPRESNCVILIA